MQGQIDDLQGQVDALEVIATTMQQDSIDLTDVSRAFDFGTIRVPSSIEKPSFICGGRIALWATFGQGSTCPGTLGE
jgi:hypothetical protein